MLCSSQSASYLCQPHNCNVVLVTVAGIERYKILKVIQKQPVLIAEVEMMPAEEDNTPKVCQLPSLLTFSLPSRLQYILLLCPQSLCLSGRILTICYHFASRRFFVMLSCNWILSPLTVALCCCLTY